MSELRKLRSQDALKLRMEVAEIEVGGLDSLTRIPALGAICLRG